MTIRQRICGFFGHKSVLYKAFFREEVIEVRLMCKKCQFKTKWFKLY